MKRRNRPAGRKGKERKKGRELGEIWMERRVAGERGGALYVIIASKSVGAKKPHKEEILLSCVINIQQFSTQISGYKHKYPKICDSTMIMQTRETQISRNSKIHNYTVHAEIWNTKNIKGFHFETLMHSRNDHINFEHTYMQTPGIRIPMNL
jgi:hypothetical protein